MSTTADILFALLTTATAPAASSPMLAKVQESLGFIPNLMPTLANNPTILLTVSLENNCNYCAAEHSAIVKGMFHTPPEFVEAVHSNTQVPDAKLNALVTLTKELVRERGRAKEKTIHKFLADWLPKGAGDGTSARHRAENYQQLLRPQFPPRRLTTPWQAGASSFISKGE